MKIKRIGTYITGFKYYKNDIEITDKILLEKIKKMKIPPAYDNVTIVNNKKILKVFKLLNKLKNKSKLIIRKNLKIPVNLDVDVLPILRRTRIKIITQRKRLC